MGIMGEKNKMSNRDFIGEGFQIIVLFLMFVAIFPLLATQIFDAITTGIVVGLVISMIVIVIWILFNKDYFNPYY
jgi:uncharacterized membrane protein YjgN (DUF898 family)